MADSNRAETKHRCAFIAVGTELTSGELVDSNSAWVSRQLHELHFEMVFHQTVADDAEMIRRAFDQAAEVADLIFVSGGLGPTKDDFTREIIATWANAPLARDESAIKRLHEKFASRGRTIHQFQEQQCYFPEGARVLLNDAGTADAFYLKINRADHKSKDESKNKNESSSTAVAKHLWTLPGPPREIASVWPEIAEQLKSFAPESQSKILRSWLCLGEGESVISHLTEGVVDGKPFETGYRAHAPYVEVKIWGAPQAWKEHNQLQALDQALAEYTISKSRETCSTAFFDQLLQKHNRKSVIVLDGVTSGLWVRELDSFILKKMNEFDSLQVVFQSAEELGSVDESWQKISESNSELVFGMCHLPNQSGTRFYAKTPSGLQSEDFILQKKHNISQRFNVLLAAEKACAFWLKALTSSK